MTTFCCLKNSLKRMPYCINISILIFFPKYFCRVDDSGMKSKLAFEVARAGYRNQQESLRFVQLQSSPAEVKQERNGIVD